MKTLFKKKTSKPSKKEKEILPVTNESEKIPKRSIFRRFYTSVFLRNENHIQTLKQSFTQKFNQEQETEDLILFYLLEMNKPEKNPSNLIQAQPQITQIINRNFIANITKELNNVDINIKFFSSFCKEGIPSQCSIIRPISWKLMLAYLPSRKAEWKETLQSKRLLYQDYVDLSFLIKKKNNSSLSETSITEKKYK